MSAGPGMRPSRPTIVGSSPTNVSHVAGDLTFRLARASYSQ